MEIGKRIKQRRESLGLSQDELAKKLGYSSRSTINKIEKGINDITQSKIVAFAKALETTPAYLMGWTKESEELAEKIKKLRKKKGETIMTMANNLGIDVKLFNDYESGSRIIPDEMLEKIASYFDMTVDELIGDEITSVVNNNNIFASNDPAITEQHRRWFDEFDGVEWNEDEFEELVDFARYLISKRKR